MAKTMITEHFSLEEMTHSAYLDRINKNRKEPYTNIPNDGVMENLRVLCNNLEKIRNYLGMPLVISSGYRNEFVNYGVGGSRTSLHVQGAAADISLTIDKILPAAVFAMNLPCAREVFISANAKGGTWLHFGVETTGTGCCRVGIDYNGKVKYALHYKSI